MKALKNGSNHFTGDQLRRANESCCDGRCNAELACSTFWKLYNRHRELTRVSGRKRG